MIVSVALTLALSLSPPLPPPDQIAPADQVAIARAFAPTFVFHPDEAYFPTTPLFPLVLDRASIEWDALQAMTPAALDEQLGTVPSRVARYEKLSLAEKLTLATVQWRVYRIHEGRSTFVAVEYWCYYAFNRFHLHGGVFPVGVQDNHNHDLERVFLVLEPRTEAPDAGDRADDGRDIAWARRAYRIRRIIASAHAGVVAANRVNVPKAKEMSTPPDIIVELGSHAMAPDLNGDGLFTLGVDHSRQNGFVWGIRDHGAMWSRYRASYMDRRDPGTAVRLCPKEKADDPTTPAPGCSPYILASSNDLQEWFENLRLTVRQRARIVGTTSRTMRVFGDVNGSQLMVPSDPPDGSMLHTVLMRASHSERGFLAGVMTAVHSTGPLVGGRIALPVNVPGMPDLLAEAIAMAPMNRKPRAEATLLGFYRTDAVLKVVGGAGWFTGPRRGFDTVAGVEFRAGRLRVRPTMHLKARDFQTRVLFVF